MTTTVHTGPAQGLAQSPAQGIGMADHFVMCSRLGRYLTFQASGRFLITDDFATPKLSIPKDAQALAAICSKDELVARAALLPLAHRAASLDDGRREAFEELFELIERQTLSPKVREGALAVLQSGFRENRIRELEAVLSDDLSPARTRYRKFLEVVRELIEGRLASGTFIDEFVDFTKSVAGRLDFGIYSYCMDRIIATPLIPLQVKKMVTVEIMRFPPLIRRELLSNALANGGVDRPTKDFVRHAISMHLPKGQLLEIELLEAVKERRITAQEIENTLNRASMAASYSGVSGRA
jgi:hypothetical protein